MQWQERMWKKLVAACFVVPSGIHLEELNELRKTAVQTAGTAVQMRLDQLPHRNYKFSRLWHRAGPVDCTEHHAYYMMLILTDSVCRERVFCVVTHAVK
jgi:hypothetical protein